MNIILFAILSATISILFGIILIKKILKYPAGDDKMKEIATAIQEGSKAFLTRQYKTISYIAIFLFYGKN